MSYRGNDNFQNSKQYILDQLFILDYNDDIDFNTIKMKLWVLDGPIRESEYVDEETPDKDVDNPMNHWGTLLNDLTYIDRYIRTEEGDLEEDEDNFDEFWNKRIDRKNKWLENNEDWQQPYNQRPTLLEKSDFEDIYSEFIIKRDNGELQNANDIVKSVTDYCIDMEIEQSENAAKYQKDSSEIEDDLKQRAEEERSKGDYNYVLKMQDIHDELWNGIVTWLRDDFQLPEPPESTDENTDIYYENEQKIIVNMPTRREQVGLEKDHSSHRGMIIESENEGGYRFVKYRDDTGDPISLPINNMTFNDNISPNLENKLEDNWEDIIWGSYYEEIEETTSTDEETGDTTTTTTKTAYLDPERSKDDLPSGDDNKGSNTIERFNLLNDRWININKLREYKMMNTGTRSIIESMLNAEISSQIKDDMEKFVDTKTEHKVVYTEMLRDDRGEFN